MTNSKKLWIILILSVTGAFTILGFFGQEVYQQAPPIPDRVVTSEGQTLFTGDQILDGQQVWQSIGGQQVGSIWGHGAYQAPDWSAEKASGSRRAWAMSSPSSRPTSEPFPPPSPPVSRTSAGGV